MASKVCDPDSRSCYCRGALAPRSSGLWGPDRCYPPSLPTSNHGLREVSALYLANSSKPPRARLAYTYLVSWYVLHCPALMIPVPSLDLVVPFIGGVAECSWTLSQRPEILQFLSRPKNYQLYRCPPSFDE